MAPLKRSLLTLPLLGGLARRDGRAPNVEGLDLETAGVDYDHTGVLVDDRLQTTNRRVFASGDVCLPAKFTLVAGILKRWFAWTR